MLKFHLTPHSRNMHSKLCTNHSQSSRVHNRWKIISNRKKGNFFFGINGKIEGNMLLQIEWKKGKKKEKKFQKYRKRTVSHKPCENSYYFNIPLQRFLQFSFAAWTKGNRLCVLTHNKAGASVSHSNSFSQTCVFDLDVTVCVCVCV